MVCALGASLLLVFGALPAVAAADTFVVNTTADGLPIPGDESCTGAIGIECTLREAINAANGKTGADTISFAGLPGGQSQLVVEEASLPTIFEGVTIDGDTAPGATPGVPAIELIPVNMSPGAFTTGLNLHGGFGSRIEGFAIGGFTVGIDFGPTEGGLPVDTEICGNYLGVELNGEVANPNRIGVEVGGSPSEQPEGTVIGSPGAGCAANAIGANTEFGISDSGFETTIGGNLIGIGPTGEILPNGTPDTGSAGILETSSATKVKQKEGSGLVVLELLDTGVCPAPKRPALRAAANLFPGTRTLLTARPGKATTGKLWGSGHGNFKTEGNQGAATVRGTIWLVEDRCNGTTFFKTRRGVVSVRDFVLHRTLSLPAGKSYVAGAG